MSKLLVLIVILAVLIPLDAPAENGPGTEARAELSLDEVLRLYRENSADDDTPEAPPVAATVDRLELDGRLLDHAVELTAKVGVSVLAADTWVTVPLLTKSGDLSLSKLPTVENGTFVVDDGQLVFIARSQGRYTFELGLLLAAETADTSRRAMLEVAETPLAVLRLRYDETVFDLPGHRRSSSDDGVVLFPRDKSFEIVWEQLDSHAEAVAAAPPAPPLDPVVTRAVQDVVCTLEGQCLTRVLYELRINGAGTVHLEVPQGSSLERIYRNGVAMGFAGGSDSIPVEVIPFRSGDESGTLEVVYSDSAGSYTLAGDLSFSSPSVSWQVHELFLVLHLPEVFTYSWTGGSLQPAAAPEGVSYSHLLPTPGSTLSFHQHLVSESIPRVTMAYNIDLDGQYFKP